MLMFMAILVSLQGHPGSVPYCNIVCLSGQIVEDKYAIVT